MAWMIVSDSSCDIRELRPLSPGVQFSLVPFKVRIGQREYVDLATLNIPQMMQAMTDYNGASTTACPSPEEWAERFLQADQVIALTISSNLSGSYNAAVAARAMVLEEYPDKQIFILDTLSCSGALASAALLANRLIGEGAGFEEVCVPVRGIFYCDVFPGDYLKKGQPIGRVEDCFGNHLADVRAPADGKVMYITHNPAMIEDDFVLDMAVHGG